MITKKGVVTIFENEILATGFEFNMSDKSNTSFEVLQYCIDRINEALIKVLKENYSGVKKESNLCEVKKQKQ